MWARNTTYLKFRGVFIAGKFFEKHYNLAGYEFYQLKPPRPFTGKVFHSFGLFLIDFGIRTPYVYSNGGGGEGDY